MSQIADFEDFIIPADSALFGQDQVVDGDTNYVENIYSFETNYNSAWMYYSGFAFSNVTDNTTSGYGNQFSAITGSGNSGSANYSICYIDGYSNNRVFQTDMTGKQFIGMYVTNTTYAYYSMLNGDSFSKKFGEDTSATGVIDGSNGEDWFLLTIYALGADSMRTGDSVNFYLADYRFSSDADDYIIDSWTWVDLLPVYDAKGLDFELSSSDTSGGFGMNTPAYFAMDQLTMGYPEGISEQNRGLLSVYPNPSDGILWVETKQGGDVYVYGLDGKLLIDKRDVPAKSPLDLSDLTKGIYLIKLVKDGRVSEQKFIKQ